MKMQVLQTICLESSFRILPNWSEIGKMITICWHSSLIIFFWGYSVSLAKFNYWSKFHVTIITSSGIMTIFFYEGLTRNLEIWNTPVWVLPNIFRLGRVRDNKFDMSLMKCCWMLQNASVTAFTISELLRKN